MISGDVGALLVDAVHQQRKELQNALRRRSRAAKALAEADHDIAAISGALAALEGIYRRLNAEEKAGAEEPPPAPAPAVQTYQTLGGLMPLNSES